MLGSPQVSTITHEQVIEVCNVLGLDPAGLLSITINRKSVDVEFLALNDQGHKFAIGDELATSRLTLPVTGGQWQRGVLVDCPVLGDA
jgi:hypothetical protein